MWQTNPEVVESSGSQPLSGDVFGERFDHARLLHGQDGSRNEFSVISDRKVPGANPHHVIKGEFDDETTFRANLEARKAD